MFSVKPHGSVLVQNLQFSGDSVHFHSYSENIKETGGAEDRRRRNEGIRDCKEEKCV
jgi:hypothetical protein